MKEFPSRYSTMPVLDKYIKGAGANIPKAEINFPLQPYINLNH